MIPLTGTGGLFTRLGAIGHVLQDVSVFQATTLPTDISAVVAQYEGGIAAEQLFDGIGPQLIAAQSSAGTIVSFLSQIANSTLNEMVFSDNPQFTNTSVPVSLAEVIRQMKAASQTVLKMTVAATPAANAGNRGDGVLVATSYRADGLLQENQFNETVRVTCTSDSTGNPNLAGGEAFVAQGSQAEPNVFSQDWPRGSGGQAGLSAINAGSNNSGGNLLTNSDFETWTVANVPDGWVITVGTAGTQVKESTAQHYTGAASLNLVGDGGTLTALTQQFGTTSGTPGVPANLSLYAANCWVLADVVPAAGVLEITLVDGSGAVVNDAQGNPSTFTTSLPALTANTWTAFNGVLRLPYILPATLKLRLRLSTALSTGTNLYIDRLGMGAMSQLYRGGPSLAVFGGSSSFYAPDGFTVACSNGRGSGGTLGTFQTLADRLFGMKQLGLLLPSSASPSISDALI